MGTDLRFVMPLLRLLNQTAELKMNYQDVCSKLGIEVEVLQDTALAVNEIEPLLMQEGEDLLLVKKLDLLDAKTVYNGVAMRGRFALKDVSVSTNAELIEERDNLVSGDALVAEIQTQGRTLHGTRWLSSIGSNIMLSMAFKFDSLQALLGFSLAIGVAATTALEGLGVQNVKLKWPNDLVYEDKKLAGILIESVATSDGSIFAIVGIGLNVHRSKSISNLIDRPYTTLEDMGYSLSRTSVCTNLINEIKYAATVFKKEGLSPFIDFWHKHDALLGYHVDVMISSRRKVSGRVAGVNKLGELILESNSNSGRTVIRSGHIIAIRH